MIQDAICFDLENESAMDYAQRVPIVIHRDHAETLARACRFNSLDEAIREWAENAAYLDQDEYAGRCFRRGESPNLIPITEQWAERFIPQILRTFSNLGLISSELEDVEMNDDWPYASWVAEYGEEPNINSDEFNEWHWECHSEWRDRLTEANDLIQERLNSELEIAFPEYAHLI